MVCILINYYLYRQTFRNSSSSSVRPQYAYVERRETKGNMYVYARSKLSQASMNQDKGLKVEVRRGK